jgi:hypothetical protein
MARDKDQLKKVCGNRDPNIIMGTILRKHHHETLAAVT